MLSIQVCSPDLLTLRGSQPGAKLVFPYSEGRLIDIATSDPGYDEVNLDYGGWFHPLLLGIIYDDGIIGTASYNHLDMLLWERVFNDSMEGRLGAIGVNFNYRYAPTNPSAAAFIDVFDSETTELTVQLTILGDYDEDQDVDWMDGAKYIRDQVQSTPESRYLTSFITKGGRATDEHISQYLERIRKLYHLIDHNKVYNYIIDYSHIKDIKEIFGVEGEFDPELGTLDDLKEAFQTAEESYNTFLSFDDIYKDYYVGTPGYDPDLREVAEDGNPIQGSEAYSIDPYDYAIKEGLERVRKTLERYPVKESYHIDILSVFVTKDYSLTSPSSRERNMRGIQLIIDEFAKYGVNVTSEVLTGYFVESGLGYFLEIPSTQDSYTSFSETEYIPLIEFIFHGKTLYGIHGEWFYDRSPAELARMYSYLEPLLLGGNAGAHINFNGTYLEIDKFYLIDLPWMTLNQRFMTDYEADENYKRVTYDADTFVEVDYDTNTYTVQVDGCVIGQDYTTFFPKDDNTFLIFSRDAKTLSELLPDGWVENPTLVELTEDGVGDAIPFQISNGMITFDVEENVPYKLTNTPNSDEGNDNSDEESTGGGSGGGGGGCFIRGVLE